MSIKKDHKFYNKILKKLDEMDIKIEDLIGDRECQALIPSYIIEDIECFIGERVTFLGIA